MANLIVYDIPSGEFRMHKGFDVTQLGDYIEIQRRLHQQSLVPVCGHRMGLVSVTLVHSLEHDGTVNCEGWLTVPAGPFLDVLLEKAEHCKIIRLRGTRGQLPAVDGVRPTYLAGIHEDEICNN